MRVTSGVARHKRKKRIMKAVKGYYGRRKNCLRTSIEAMEQGRKYAFKDRRRRKRDFRRLWITRISAAARARGISYSRLVSGLSKAQVAVDRKQMATLAISAPEAFDALVAKAKEANEAA